MHKIPKLSYTSRQSEYIIVRKRDRFKLFEFFDFAGNPFKVVWFHFEGVKFVEGEDFRGEIDEFVAGEIEDE